MITLVRTESSERDAGDTSPALVAERAPSVEHGVMLSIGAVERDTGLSKDVLRMWERRYRYPTPLRDEHGERVYPPEQVTKLRAIKRLMDRGFRPGKIIGLPIDELSALGTSHASSEQRDAGIVEVIELIRAHRLPDFRQRLQQMLMRQGLQRFVMDTVAPLTVAVGEAWVRGEFAVFEEHLYTEQVQGVLRNAIASAQGQGRSPRVLLTSFPTEQHNLGLLMVEALLVVEGVICIPLGTETPAVEIVRAADAHRANAVALSFSAAFPDRQASSGLRELRALLPRGIEIWAGGSCVRRLRRGIDGVQFVKSLDQVSQLVGAWRSSHGMP